MEPDTEHLCIAVTSGKLDKYIVMHAFYRGYEFIGFCRVKNPAQLNNFKARLTVIPGIRNDSDAIETTVVDCDA